MDSPSTEAPPANSTAAASDSPEKQDAPSAVEMEATNTTTSESRSPAPRRLRKRKAKAEDPAFDYEPVAVADHWVCCEKCEKWRRCKRKYGDEELFVCEQNDWDKYNKCSIPEEKWQQPSAPKRIPKEWAAQFEGYQSDLSPLDNERAWVQCSKCEKWKI